MSVCVCVCGGGGHIISRELKDKRDMRCG